MTHPLIQAVKDRDYLGVRTMLAQGGDPDVRDANNETALTWAAHLGHTSIVKDLLAANADREAAGNLLEGTPLLLACRNGHRGIVALLAALSDPDRQTRLGATALMLALEPRHDYPKSPRSVYAILKVLADAGADLDLQDESGHTALMHAARWGDHEAARILLERGASPNLSNREGQTARDIADEAGDLDMVALFRTVAG